MLGALSRLGIRCLSIAPVAGATGRLFAALVDERNLPIELTNVDGMTRVAVSFVARDRREATVINGPGPRTDNAAWLRHVARVEALAASGEFDYVVVAGRPPPTATADLTARVCALAAEAGARTVVDVASPVLEHALDARPWLVKVNLLEAEQLTGITSDPLQAATRLRLRGAENAIVTDGANNVGADFMGARFAIAPPEVVTRSAVGCGDCFLAGLLHALHADVGPTDAVSYAIAIASAAAETLAPGDFDAVRARELLNALSSSTAR